jgi:uncharacterized protein (TIGR00255 family)
MTGFGKASCEFNGSMLSIELSTVNHRFLDCSCRLPSSWWAVEPLIKQAVRERISRGRMGVNVNRKRSSSSSQVVHFDRVLAEQYAQAAREMGQMLGTNELPSLNVLAQLEGVFYQEEADEDLEAVGRVVVGAVNEALDQLDAMRTAEGRVLEQDLRQRVTLICDVLGGIVERLPTLNQLYEKRLRARIDELKGEVPITEERIAMEVALLAEKGDVTEETVRLTTHLDHFLELLDAPEPIGRKLDFLTQEIQREINTLGVKTRDGDVTKEVLRMKAELEKIREQIQNIE